MIKDRKKAPSSVPLGGTGVDDQTVNEVLRSIRQIESSGNYGARAKTSSASGAYQFIDKTWGSLTSKYGIGTEYKSAADAPNTVQDKVAEKYVREILASNGGDVTAVPNVWFTGNPAGKMTPAMMAANPGVDSSTYSNKFFKVYSGGALAATTLAATKGRSSTAIAAGVAGAAIKGKGGGSSKTLSGERKQKNKKSAKKKIRAELDKLVAKKTNRPIIKDNGGEPETAEQIWTEALQKKKQVKNNPTKVIISVIKSLKNIAKKAKSNNQDIISSIEKSASELSALKNKDGIKLGSVEDFSPEMMKPQEFSIGDRPYLYYPGGPEGRQIYEKSKTGTAGKIAPREIQKLYTKRKNVDDLHGSNINNVLGAIEDMLDNDSALRKKEFEKLMDYVDVDNPTSVFNLEEDEKKATLEKALTAALEEIYRKHPELLNRSGGGIGGGSGSPISPMDLSKPKPISAPFIAGAAAVGTTAAITGAIFSGAQNMASEKQQQMSQLEQYGLKTEFDSNGMVSGYNYKGHEYKSYNDLPSKARDLITAYGPGDKRGADYNKAVKALAENNYPDEPVQIAKQKTTPFVKSTFNKVWQEGEWMDPSTKLTPTDVVSGASFFVDKINEADKIIKGNVDNAEEAQKQVAAAVASAVSDQQIAQNVVNNTVVTAPAVSPKPNPESIQTDNRDPAFTNLIHGDGKVTVAYS